MYDLSKIYLSPAALNEGETMKQRYPELEAFPEFLECSDEMIKIVVLAGDIDSPFIRIRERETMLQAIFEYLNIDVRQAESMFKKILAYKHPVFMGAWLRYLQILHETEFTNWLLVKRAYEFHINETNSPREAKESAINYSKRISDAREKVRDLGVEMRNIEGKLFPDSKAAREAALAESRMKIKLYAEQYAEPFNYF